MKGSVSARPTRLALVLLAPIAGLLTVLLAWSDDSMVATSPELAAVGYGVPIDWLIQNHSWMSPPLPYELSTYDIRQSPTTVAWGAFAVDFLLVYALLLVALLVGLLVAWLVLRYVVPRAR